MPTVFVNAFIFFSPMTIQSLSSGLALDSRAPAAHSPTRRFGNACVPREYGIESFGKKHVERFVQAVEQIGRRRVRKIAARVDRDHLAPVPVRARQLGTLRCFERLCVDR